MREPELFVADQGAQSVVVREMALPEEYTWSHYRTWDGVLSADGLVMVGVGQSAHTASRPAGAAAEPGATVADLDEPIQGGAPSANGIQPLRSQSTTTSTTDPEPLEDEPSSGDCGNDHWYYNSQILRWTRPDRSSEFGEAELVSMDVDGTQACLESEVPPVEGWMGVRGWTDSGSPTVSADGSTVIFVSTAANLGADLEVPDLMFRDGEAPVARVMPSTWEGEILEAQVSGNGLHIAFVARPETGGPQVYVVSRSSVGSAWGAPVMISLVDGLPSETDSPIANSGVSISADGGRVAWVSDNDDFEEDVEATGNSVLVVWQRSNNLIHIARSRAEETDAYTVWGYRPTISADGKRIVVINQLAPGHDSKLVLFDVDKIMSTNMLARVRSERAFEILEPHGILGRPALAGTGGVYQVAFAADGGGPLDRYADSPPAIYLVGGQRFGAGVSRQWHGDPVDVASGAFSHVESDNVGRNGLTLDRSYNSFSNEDGSWFGQGWASLYDARLEVNEDAQAVQVVTPEGRRLTYWETATSGVYGSESSASAVLSRQLDGYRWTERSGRTLAFNLDGDLVGVERPGLPDVSLTYDFDEDSETVLIELDDTGDRWLRLVDDTVWEAPVPGEPVEPVAGRDGLADRLESSDGSAVTYVNHGWGLQWVSRPHVVGEDPGFGRRFEWSADGRIERIVDEIAEGREQVVVDNTYDQMGRVVSQVNATGDVIDFHHGVRWIGGEWVLSPGYTTTVNEASGDRVAYKYGPGGEAVATTDALGASTATEWAGDQRKSVTSRSGVKVDTAFDAALRPINVTETVGGVTRTVASYSYLVAATTAGAVSDQRLSSSTDAAGVTTWFTYNAAVSNSTQLPYTIEVPCDSASLSPGLSCPGTGRAVTAYVYGTGDLEGLAVSVTDPDGVVTEYEYAADRTVSSVSTFPDGSSEVSTTREVLRRGDTGFDESNPLAAWVEIVTDQTDAVTETVYGPEGQVLEVRDPLFNGTTHLATTYDYWGNGDLKSVTDPGGDTTTYDTLRPSDAGFAALDEVGVDPAEISVVTDPDGVSTVTVVDRSGDVVATASGDVTVPAELAVTTYTYGALGRLATSTDPEGVVTRYGYDTEGRVTQTTVGAALGAPDRTTTNVYDARGRLVEVTGPTSDDPDDNPVQSRQAFSYDNAGRMTARVDGNPAVTADQLMTSFHYDTAGRQWRTVEHRAGNLNPSSTAPAAGDAVVETRFTLAGRTAATATAPVDDPAFNWSTAADIDKAWTTYGYDDAGRQTTITGPDETTWTTGYDDAGRVTTRTSPEGRQTGYGYDDAGRLVAVSAPSPTGTGFATTITTYTPTGQVASETDPHVPQIGVTDPSTRFFEYTDAGRLETVTDALGNTVTYTYDERGNRETRVAVDDNDDPVTETWHYDQADRLTAHTTPAPTVAGTPQTTSYGYDPATGWLTDTTDPTGRVTTLGHYGDGTIRSTTHTGPSMPTITTSHWRNSRGWATKSVTSNGTTTDTTQHGYNRSGQPTSTITPAGETLEWVWDLAGNPIERSDPNGTTGWTHHRDNQIAAISQDTGAGPYTIATYSYDDDGLLLNEDLVTGGSRSWVYNDAAKADTYTQVTSRPDTSVDTWTAELEWRTDGRLHTETINSDPTVTYSYDAAGQLTAATNGGTIDLAWTYGTRGNRLTSTDNATTTTWDTNPNGSVAATTTGAATTSYDYDLAGRRTTATTGTNTVTTSYDTAGRLTTITDGTTTWGRRYDANNNIAAHTVDDGTTTVTTSQITDHVTGPYSQTLGQSTDNGTTWTLNLHGPAGPIGETATPAIYQTDHHGSVIQDPTNPAVADAPANYDPHGQPNTSVTDHQLGYRAEQTTAGLTYLRNRDYDPQTGTLLTPDPLDGINGTPTVANPYHYADNDPLNKTDPLGLRADDDLFDIDYEDRCFESTGVPGQLWTDPAGDQGLGCWALEVTGPTGPNIGGVGFGSPMNAAEWAWCNNPSRYKMCHEAQTAAEKARAEAARRFNDTDQDYYANQYGVDYTGKSDRVGSTVEGLPPDGSKGNAYQHMVWNGLMAKMMGKESAKGFADRHETDSWTVQFLYFRGMDFANNHYGRELASRLMASSDKNFEQVFFEEAERFVKEGGKTLPGGVQAGRACWIQNFATAAPYGTDNPVYADPSRCGAG